MSDVSSLQSELCVHRSPGPGFFIQLNFERQMTSHLPKHLGSKFDVSPWGPRKALSFTSKGHWNWLELSKAQDSLITKAEFPAQDCINSVSRSSSFRLETGMPISGVSLTDSCFYPLHHPLEEQKTAASASHAEPISPEIISCCLSSWTIEARFPVELCPLFQMFRSSTSSIITSCFLCPFHLARDDVHWGSVPWESKKDMIFAFWSV